MSIDPDLIQEMSSKKDTSVIPLGEDCYKLVPIQTGEVMHDDPEEYGKQLREYTYLGNLKQVLCPYWHKTDYGMVQCRFLEIEGLIEDEDGAWEKAVHHFGSSEALFKANQATLLFDEIKYCGINELD